MRFNTMKLNRPLDCSTGSLWGEKKKACHALARSDISKQECTKGYFQTARSYVCYPSFFFCVRFVYEI